VVDCEKYVREKWDEAHAFWASTEIEAWQAAYDFTLQREEEIRQAEAEITWIRGFGHIGTCNCCGVRDRVLARAKEHLATLKLGMRTDAPARKEK
jgi:hypothetical protein